ncbi:MAG: hypothetical protein EXQ88_01565 [Alphaproteobacteria bacterium]|nr:hypothetical protein [Alphaproteobacteria bacterium]
MVIDGEALRGRAADLAAQVERTFKSMEKLDKQGQKVSARVAGAIEAAESTLETCKKGLEAAVARCVDAATASNARATETLKQVFHDGKAVGDAQHKALTAATNIALTRADTLKSELQGLALEAEGAVNRVLGGLPERLAEADERTLILEQRIESILSSLSGRIESAFSQGEERLSRLAELADILERSGGGANEALGATIAAIESERKALEESVAGASEMLARVGASIKGQGRVATVTADSVMTKLKQLEGVLTQQVQLLERAAQSADRVPLVAAVVGPSDAAPAATESPRALITAPAAGEARPAPSGTEKMDPMAQLRGSIGSLSELASLLVGILGDKVEAGLGHASVADRSAALRRLTEQSTQTSGPDSAGVKLYKLPQARLLADKFMTRFERLLRDAGDGSADDMLPVILLTTDVGKVYLALSKLSTRDRPETARAIQ